MNTNSVDIRLTRLTLMRKLNTVPEAANRFAIRRICGGGTLHSSLHSREINRQEYFNYLKENKHSFLLFLQS